MARLAGGHEFLEAAVTQAANAKTISELRMAQALLMPLKFGLSLDDTSVALGLSKSWTLRLRQRFGRIQGGQEQPKSKRGQRNRARMTLEEEAALLAPYIEQARQGGVIIVPPLKAELEKALGRSMAQSTVYAMLHRHGWRKLAPDKQHPESDPVAQEEWKKTPRNYPPSQRAIRQVGAAEAHVSGRGALWAYLANAMLLVSKAFSSTYTSDGDAGIYLCLCGRLTVGRSPRHVNTTQRQWCLYANLCG